MEAKVRDATKPTPLRRQTAIAEVVEASTTRLRAVARVVFEPPSFGAFVRCDGPTLTTFAVVSHVEHGTLDPSRRAIPLGRSWDEIAREQPQVLELLSTEFDAQIVAFAQAGQIRAWLPPVPPRVHDFVYPCTPPEVRSLTEDVAFVRTLAASTAPWVDELVAAAIRAAAEAREDAQTYLVRAGREVADLYRQDYERARAVLRRVGMRGT